jgi:hypothetical protein
MSSRITNHDGFLNELGDESMQKHPQLEVGDLSRVWPSAHDAVAHALKDMEAALSSTRFQRKKGGVYYEMRRDMPYMIHATKTLGVQILVNRNYKPLGSNEPTGGEYLDYESYPNAHVQLTPEQIKKVVSPVRERGFFGDENPPWSGRREAKAYAERLCWLLSYLSN